MKRAYWIEWNSNEAPLFSNVEDIKSCIPAETLDREKVQEIMSDAFLKCSPFNTKEVTDKIMELVVDEPKRMWKVDTFKELEARAKIDKEINQILLKRSEDLQAKLTKATDALRELSILGGRTSDGNRIAQRCLDEICVSDKPKCETQPNLECPNCHYILTPIIEDCDTQPIEPLDLDQGSIYIQCSQNVLNGVEWTVASKINEIIDRLKEKGI